MPRATSLMGVPTFYVRLLEHPGLTREATEHMRLFVCGSAPLLAETHERWRERTGHAILERYGMTETKMITSNPYDGERERGDGGLSPAGVSLRIADPDTAARSAQGEVGVIEVRVRTCSRAIGGCRRRPASELRADGFFITGDLGEIDERGYVASSGAPRT